MERLRVEEWEKGGRDRVREEREMSETMRKDETRETVSRGERSGRDSEKRGRDSEKRNKRREGESRMRKKRERQREK